MRHALPGDVVDGDHTTTRRPVPHTPADIITPTMGEPGARKDACRTGKAEAPPLRSG
jgi:hypothetical protein